MFSPGQAPSAITQEPPQAALHTVSGRPLLSPGRTRGSLQGSGDGAMRPGRGRHGASGRSWAWLEVEVTALWESLEG